MNIIKLKAIWRLFLPGMPIPRLVLLVLLGVYLWLVHRPPLDLRFEVILLALPGLLLSMRSRPLWRSENLRLLPELPLALYQCVLIVLLMVFALVGLVKLISSQPLDMLQLHFALSVILLLMARAEQSSFWLIAFPSLINAHYLFEFFGQWAHLPWVQFLFLIGNFGLIFCFYEYCVGGWSESDWYHQRQESKVRTWMAQSERRERVVRLAFGGGALLLIMWVWAQQSDAAAADLFLYYTGPLVVLGVPLIFMESIRVKMVTWWVTARDDSREALGLRAMLSLYGNTLLVAGFFAIVALTGLIAMGRINWLILSNLLLAVALAALLICTTVYNMNRLQRSGLYPIYIVSALAALALVLFWLGSFLPAGPMTTSVMVIVVVLVGTLSARFGGNALARVNLF